MAVTATPVFVQTPSLGLMQILPADTTTKKTVVTAGANGSKVVSCIVTSTDTSARVVTLSITRGGTSYALGTVSITALAGTDGVAAAIDLFKGGSTGLSPGLPIDNDGQTYLFLMSGDTLQVNSATNVTAAKVINFTSVFASF